MILVCGGLVTFAGVRSLQQARAREDSHHQDRHIEILVEALRSAMAQEQDLLRSARGYFSGSERVDASEWREYVDTLDLPRRHPGLESFAYIVPVGRQDLPEYLASQARMGNQIQIREGAPTASAASPSYLAKDLFIVQYSWPQGAAPGMKGLDLGSMPEQRAAAEAARDQDREMLTRPVNWDGIDGKAPILCSYLPVYRKGETPSNVLDRRTMLLGWVSLKLEAKPLLTRLVDEAVPRMPALEVVDVGTVEAPRPPQVLFSRGQLGQVKKTAQLEVGGRIWELRFTDALPSSYLRGELAFWVLAGMALTLSLSGLLWSLVRTRARAEALAEGRTLDLSQALIRHRAFLQQTPKGVIELDDSFHVIGWNPGATRIFGYTEDEALGRPGTFLVGASREAEVTERWMEPLSKGVSLQGIENHPAKDGSTLQCDWHVTAIQDPVTGGNLGYTAVVEDVTERLRLDDERRQAQRLESLGVLAGGLAHDFNNLLMGIQGQAEIALRAVGGESQARLPIDRILRAVERAASLAHQMLAYAGRTKAVRKQVDLNKLLTDLGDLLQVTVPKKAELVLEFQPGLPMVNADPVQLQQVAMNLITNAAEALPGGRGRMVLRTTTHLLSPMDLSEALRGQALTPGLYVVLEVEDDGMGMDAETQTKIFEPFFTTKFTGRGLGLSAVRGIVRANKGGLALRSELGKGTLFRAMFPAVSAQEADIQGSPVQTWERGGRALVVDDEEGIRSVLREFLEVMGFEVDEAADGREGLEAIRMRKDYRVALLDLTMPGLGGLELLAFVRRESPTTRVIIMSGYSEEDATDPGVMGGDAFLAKPFRLADLELALQRVLKSGSAS